MVKSDASGVVNAAEVQLATALLQNVARYMFTRIVGGSFIWTKLNLSVLRVQAEPWTTTKPAVYLVVNHVSSKRPHLLPLQHTIFGPADAGLSALLAAGSKYDMQNLLWRLERSRPGTCHVQSVHTSGPWCM